MSLIAINSREIRNPKRDDILAAMVRGDRRDFRVMSGLRNSIPLGDIKHEVWSLQAAPLDARRFGAIIRAG